MTRFSKALGLPGVGFICTFFASTAVFAQATAVQADAGSSLAEVVVTAQKREEPLQKVPVTVTAISGSELMQDGLLDVRSLEAAVPGLTLTEAGSTVAPYLRGIGSNSTDPSNEPSVATYIDGVYIPSGASNFFEFNNIERIEVLRGPQGTLFGRNATGGVIQVITKDPTHEASADASVSYGNYDSINASLYATGGLSSDLAANVALLYNDQGNGFGHNLYTGGETHKQDDLEVRSKLLFTPADSTKMLLILSYAHPHGTQIDFQLTPQTAAARDLPYPGRYNTDTDWPSKLESSHYGASFRLEQEIGAAQLVSTTAYNRVQELGTLDSDSTPVPIIRATIFEGFWNVSQEFQLLGENGPLKWQGGIFLFALRPSFHLNLAGLAAAPLDSVDISAVPKTESAAGYGQVTYRVTPRLNVTAGLRYTHDKQSIEGVTSTPTLGPLAVAPYQDQSYNKPTWRLSLDYQLAEDILAYLSYNRGVKSGGYNVTSASNPGFQPEILDAYEVGLKQELLQRRVRLNVAAFYYDYKDLQVTLQNPNGQGNATQNAASARIEGLDVDFEAVAFKNFTVSGGLEYLHTKYLTYMNALSYTPTGVLVLPPPDVAGNQLINAPKLSGSISANYRIPTDVGAFELTGAVIHKSQSFASPDNQLDYPAYTLFNAHLGWTSPSERYGVTLWINNAFDAQYIQARLQVPFGYIQSNANPRMYGATVKMHL